jgi:hypothetical protein
MIIALCVLALLYLTWYAVWGRAWLKRQDWAWSHWMFATFEPAERWLYDNSRTVLFARIKQFVGILLTILATMGSIDLTPFVPLLPDQYEPFARALINALPFAITIIGTLDIKLRKDTTLPLADVSKSGGAT